jgi:alpha-glucuronidase
MKTGRTLWNELVHKYYEGVEQVRSMRQTWNSLEGMIDPQQFEHVSALLAVQEDHAIWWRDACLLYFQTFSRMPIPAEYERPEHDLEYYRTQPRYIPSN